MSSKFARAHVPDCPAGISACDWHVQGMTLTRLLPATRRVEINPIITQSHINLGEMSQSESSRECIFTIMIIGLLYNNPFAIWSLVGVGMGFWANLVISKPDSG